MIHSTLSGAFRKSSCVPALCRSCQDILYIIWRKVQSSCIIDRLQPWQLVPTTSRLNIRSIGLNELLLLLLLPFLLLLYCSWKAKSPVLCRSITSLPAPLVADISRGGLALVSIVSSIELKTLATSNPSPPHAADWAPPLLIQKLGSSRSESGGDRRCHFRHFPFQTSEYISATQLDVSVLRGSTIAPGKGGCFRVGSTIPVGRLLQVKIL